MLQRKPAKMRMRIQEKRQEHGKMKMIIYEEEKSKQKKWKIMMEILASKHRNNSLVNKSSCSLIKSLHNC
jgi:hypothetical protein